jgi:hypothetical protein
MFLKEKTGGHLVEVLTMSDLINPIHSRIVGRFHCGEEMQDPERFSKLDLCFPSGESLPRCWVDVNFRSEHPDLFAKAG